MRPISPKAPRAPTPWPAFANIDMLVNNAGAIPGGSLLDFTMERWQDAWDLKVMGYVHMTQLAFSAMQPRKSGIIINIIGMAGPAPSWDYICGSTGNAAFNAFTKAIGAKSVDWGIRVFGINPAAHAHRAHHDASRSQRAKTQIRRRKPLGGDADQLALRPT